MLSALSRAPRILADAASYDRATIFCAAATLKHAPILLLCAPRLNDDVALALEFSRAHARFAAVLAAALPSGAAHEASSQTQRPAELQLIEERLCEPLQEHRAAIGYVVIALLATQRFHNDLVKEYRRLHAMYEAPQGAELDNFPCGPIARPRSAATRFFLAPIKERLFHARATDLPGGLGAAARRRNAGVRIATLGSRKEAAALRSDWQATLDETRLRTWASWEKWEEAEFEDEKGRRVQGVPEAVVEAELGVGAGLGG